MTTLLTMKGFNRQVQPITTAGIYHNPSLGLISLSSDGSNWITIADKNLGATQVYNDGDTLSEANCGKYFQWGNNYGFPFTGAVTTSSAQVNAQNYGPGNYYNSSTFITSNKWDSSVNANLRGGETGTNEAMQGPCTNGYHIPTNIELQSLLDILGNWGLSGVDGFKTKLKMPLAGYRQASNSNVVYQGENGLYWASNIYTNSNYRYRLYVGVNVNADYPGQGFPIRPFKSTPVQPDDSWEVLYEYHEPEYLCFTANTAGSTIALNKNGSPTAVTLETSTDGQNWSTYTFGSTITLSNVGDKVYFRNTSETTTGFSTDISTSYYRFAMTGSIAASGDVTTLINKNGTDTLSNYCFATLFYQCSSLTTPPELLATTLGARCYNTMFYQCTSLTTAPSLPATTLTPYCYVSMFNSCTSLTTLPKLSATTLAEYCYSNMFFGCSKIKLSTSKTGEYQNEYRIPTTGTGTNANYAVYRMFMNTGGTWTGTPTINTTYYTSNTVI